jgi:hypothetical protein
LRVDGHQRAAPLAKHLLDQLLQLDVDRQPHVLPGVAGWLARRRTARPPAEVSICSTPVVPCSTLS